MITKKLFDKIQEALRDNGKPRKKPKVKNFPFLGFAKCGECGYAITAEKQVKKSGLEFVYYYCTYKSKTQKCSQRGFLREEKFAEQVKEQCQKVSLPDVWRDRFLDKLKKWENENPQTSDLFAQNLKKKIDELKTKINRLTDAYLEGTFELAEFQQKKNALTSEKKTLEEKLSDFERKGNHWLELTRNWIIEANQAKNLALQEDFSEMKNFIKKIGLNRQISQQKLLIDFKKPFDLLAKLPAEARGEAPSEAANSIWWS
ncbi:MAG TPA: zinc ribbon domain-containing protein [Candidatus Paceibacterota bacterium]|nr:zinc ribbon domain-containing protein [Candidatus Paceibacterota bacterium]